MVTRPNVPSGTGGERAQNHIRMYTVYVIKSGSRLYKGMTNDLKRRLAEHRRGKTKTTSKMRDFMLVHCEMYNDFDAARKRELYLKTAAGRRFIKKVLNMAG